MGWYLVNNRYTLIFYPTIRISNHGTSSGCGWREGLQIRRVAANILNKWRRMGWAGHVARMGVGRGVYRVLAGRPEGKRPLGRPRRRWDDNIKMALGR
jgi:hypothetical protein